MTRDIAAEIEEAEQQIARLGGQLDTERDPMQRQILQYERHHWRQHRNALIRQRREKETTG